MARLQLEDGTELSELEAIVQVLAPLGLWLAHDDDQPALVGGIPAELDPSESSRERLLASLDERLTQLRIVEPLVSRDLLVLDRTSPSTAAHLQRFSVFHTHPDDEGRYIVSGACRFGLVITAGLQALLTLQAGDVLRLPAGLEHWFDLTELGSLRAVRLFSHHSALRTTVTGRTIAPALLG